MKRLVLSSVLILAASSAMAQFVAITNQSQYVMKNYTVKYKSENRKPRDITYERKFVIALKPGHERAVSVPPHAGEVKVYPNDDRIVCETGQAHSIVDRLTTITGFPIVCSNKY